MNRFTFGAAAAALAFALPVAAPAQQLPPAVVGVVDTDRIMRECTVCAAANTQLQQQLQQLQQRADALRTPIQTEGQAIETALRALPQGQQPDAALTQRITAFQTQQQTAQQEIGTRQQQVERNVAFVRQQIGQRIEPAIQQVMQQRGATIVVDAGATLAIAQSVDITPAVLAVVNQNTTPLNVNAPPPQQQAQQPQQQQPQGR
ncbi:OmpH family outer membrane protein [Sphingosinicella sp. CPCC 101087]|uniref:OmpH family outer membrane protein n=1 Tax=Sphingosinicella sp. CPCC 101087 TaxID=2497754 RepID=UPI00101BD929|nr:OmpH family outer membrane protein [Sphingosinicella sp. CPCC 101087]